eukprot:gene7757-8601_t
MDLIKSLVDESLTHETPWPACRFDEDFILISEFSELEGPRPLLTIPEKGGGNFNKSTFTVRIMSVDCTSPISSSEPGMKASDTAFKTVGDTQVVLVEPSEGATAYVHHFTLYDIHARGFVRPFCLSYVTHQGPKIMTSFTSFRDYFGRISRYFKFGNAMVFLQELRKRHEYLSYTRQKLLNNNQPIGSCYQLPFDMKGYNFESIEESLRDSDELQSIIISYLNSEMFSEQRNQYSQEFDCLLQYVIDDETSLEDLDKKYADFQPRNVGITSGRKFDVQLRTLEDLSSPSKPEAFSLLQRTYMLFSRCKDLEALQDIIAGTRTTKDLHEIDRQASMLSTKMSTDVFLSPVKKSTKRSMYTDFTDYDTQSLPSISSRHPFSDEFNNTWDPNFQWTCQSWTISRSDSFELIQKAQNSSTDDNFSLKDAEIISLASTYPSSVSIPSSSNFSGHSGSRTTLDQLPGSAKRLVTSLQADARHSSTATITNRQMSRGSDEIDATGCPTRAKSPPVANNKVSLKDSGNDSGSESSQGRIDRQNSTLSHGSNKSASSNTSRHTTNSSSNRSMKDTRPSADLFDPPAEGTENTHGISLVTLRQNYSFFTHLVYSLMIGRPVVISAEKDNRQQVHCIIVSLLPCIPGLPLNKNSVVFWTAGPFHVLNLATVKLVGLMKCRGRDPVSKSILPYVTVLDFEASSLTAPPYEGTYLCGMFDRQKDWPSASVFLEALHGIQIELSTQAFLMFSLTFADGDCQTSHASVRNEPRTLSKTVNNSPAMKINPQGFFQFRFLPQDIRIIEYLVEILKDNLTRSYHRLLAVDSDDGENENEAMRHGVIGAFSCINQNTWQRHSETPSIKLNLMKCHTFSNTIGKKK